MKTVKLSTVVFICLGFLLTMATAITGTWFGVRKQTLKEVGISSESFFAIDARVSYIPNFENKYSSFIDDEKAEFIVKVSKDFGVDPDLVVAVLEKENPSLIEDATSRPNENGTRDLGYFQLNDRSLFGRGGFLELWWKPEFGEFNADNWKHNTYIAVKYLQDLQNTFGANNIYYIAAGYNAGTPRAYEAYITGDKNKLPYSTAYFYAPTVGNNYTKWKSVS